MRITHDFTFCTRSCNFTEIQISPVGKHTSESLLERCWQVASLCVKLHWQSEHWRRMIMCHILDQVVRLHIVLPKPPHNLCTTNRLWGRELPKDNSQLKFLLAALSIPPSSGALRRARSSCKSVVLGTEGGCTNPLHLLSMSTHALAFPAVSRMYSVSKAIPKISSWYKFPFLI